MYHLSRICLSEGLRAFFEVFSEKQTLSISCLFIVYNVIYQMMLTMNQQDETNSTLSQNEHCKVMTNLALYI